MSADVSAVKISLNSNRALSKSNSEKSHLAKHSYNSANHKTTDISVISRIRYNLRFTKQVVFVVGETAEQYTQRANEFLVNLSHSHEQHDDSVTKDSDSNIAYLSASKKLDDIQIRCRLIEQLFANSLFDPEQSLAVTLIKFAEQQQHAISIVIEHGHALSLQIKYELCQLVNAAKQRKKTVNVIMFGLLSAGQEISANKNLFKNKLTIIDGLSGKVISVNDNKLFTNDSVGIFTKKQQQLFLAGTSLLAVACIYLYLMIAVDTKKITFINEDPTAVENNVKFKVNNNHPQVTSEKATGAVKITPINIKDLKNIQKKIQQASSKDVHQALLTQYTHLPEKQSASPDDVINALNKVLIGNQASVASSEKSTQTSKQYLQGRQEDFYNQQAINKPHSYVIQIAVFNNMKSAINFLTFHHEEGLYWYQKKLNNSIYTVVTTSVCDTSSAAKKKLSQLPERLKQRKPWIKPISTIIEEINTFNQ